MIGKIICGIFGGLLFATLGDMLIGFTFVILEPVAMAVIFVVMWISAIVMSVNAENTGKAWRRILIPSGVFALIMPVATFIFTAVLTVAPSLADGYTPVETATSVMTMGGVMTFIAGTVGVFLGAVLLVVGLLVGRDPKVIIVKMDKESDEHKL